VTLPTCERVKQRQQGEAAKFAGRTAFLTTSVRGSQVWVPRGVLGRPLEAVLMSKVDVR